MNRRSHAGKARYAALSATGLTVIKPAELEKARHRRRAPRPSRRKTPVARWQERTADPSAPLTRIVAAQGPADIHQETRREVVELKTTHDLERFSASLERYRYPLSAAFYRDISQSRSVQFVVYRPASLTRSKPSP